MATAKNSSECGVSPAPPPPPQNAPSHFSASKPPTRLLPSLQPHQLPGRPMNTARCCWPGHLHLSSLLPGFSSQKSTRPPPSNPGAKLTLSAISSGTTALRPSCPRASTTRCVCRVPSTSRYENISPSRAGLSVYMVQLVSQRSTTVPGTQ